MITDRHTWILLANATHARLCVRDPADGRIQQVAQYEHPRSRLKAQALAPDRPGHVEKTEGSQRSGTALTPRADPRRKEHEAFARELADVLDRGVLEKRCDSLVLMASNPFLGELKAQLGDPARHLVRATVPSDFTQLDAPHLARRLSEVLGDLRG
jgi:protein required for attachment to host cells